MIIDTYGDNAAVCIEHGHDPSDDGLGVSQGLRTLELESDPFRLAHPAGSAAGVRQTGNSPLPSRERN